MNSLIKIIIDDDGAEYQNDYWHLICNPPKSDTARVLCTSEAIDACSAVDGESKLRKRGGITCPDCLAVIKYYKNIKI